MPRALVAALPILVAVMLEWDMVSSHGVLNSPKSRNLHAFENGFLSSFYDATALNNNIYVSDFRSSSVCGQVQGGGETGIDYDGYFVESLLEGQVYSAGQSMTVNLTLTVHHMGHFEFSLCPADPRGSTPPQECFANNKLKIIQDLIHDAPIDTTYPERAMIPPTQFGMEYSYRVAIPGDFPSGDYVLKWMYVTGNSCYPSGYEEYPIPSSWGFSYNNMLPICGQYDLATPLAVPEVFINCADVVIVGTPAPSSSPNASGDAEAPTVVRLTSSNAIPPHCIFSMTSFLMIFIPLVIMPC